ncbi:MAG: hypothetical protein KGY70_09250 [Bacteroidales bacterium]|nr:hypothetical protein [Bacteroidales bacterium]MBS3775362.1 hypothetical protein [Bacteroidales bacterium]
MKTLMYLSLIFLAVSCMEENGSYIRTTDVVPITEFSIPDSSEISDTIQIAATAEANNGCWSNLRFSLDSVPPQTNSDTDTVATQLYRLQAIGDYESHGTCPQVVVTADTIIDLVTRQKGNYVFYVTRNSYSYTVDTLLVE